MKKISKDNIHEEFPDLLTDESNIDQGWAETAYIPECSEDISLALGESYKDEIPVTLSGARTGIVGSAVPFGGNLISLSKMSGNPEIYESYGRKVISIQSGVTLGEIEDYANRINCFFPPDPTEPCASAGGIVATDASGSRSYKYGSVRNYLRRIEGFLANGKEIKITRGEYILSEDNILSHPIIGEIILDNIFPDKIEKNVAGYHLWKGIDLIDILCGSEGTLLLINKVDLFLEQKPEVVFYGIFYFDEILSIINFIRQCEEKIPGIMRSVEYFDANSIKFLKFFYKDQPGITSYLHDNKNHLIFVEFEMEEEFLDKFYEIVEIILSSSGSSIDDAFGGESDKEREIIHNIRHSLPDAINQTIKERKKIFPGLHKVGTDMAVPVDKLMEFIKLYSIELEKLNLNYVMFGHIGEGHPHVNIIPNNDKDIKSAEYLYKEIASEVVRWGGSVTAEHGLGRLKKNLLKIMYSEDVIENMKKIKKLFDHQNILGKGILWN